MITEAEFRALAAQGHNRIPLVEEVFADLDTPLSLYLKLANAPYSFLLESVVGGERFGRYSFIGLPAKVRVIARGRAVEVVDGERVIETFDGDPLAFVEQYRSRFKAAPLPGLPRFCGGLAGIFGYDVVRHVETRLAHSGKPPTPVSRTCPISSCCSPEELAVVDNLKGKISLIVYADPAHADAYARTRERLTALRRKLREPVQIPLATGTAKTTATSQFGEENFKEAVARAKEYIAAGDIMQVVIFAAHDDAVRRLAAVALPRAALAQSVAVHVLLRLRGLPRRGRVAGDPRAQGRRYRHAAPDRRHTSARRTREADEALAAELAADPRSSPST
jgi:anthranilate synthase component 1